MSLPDELRFLTKLRFWAMCFSAVMLYLEQKGLIGTYEAVLLGGLSAAFWANQTLDRSVDHLSGHDNPSEKQYN